MRAIQLGTALLLSAAPSFAQGVTTSATSGASGEAKYACRYPQLSADGRWLSFDTISENLVPGDGTHASKIVLYDRVTGAHERIDLTSSGAFANGASTAPAQVSADGRYVLFHSYADNLGGGNPGYTSDIYVRDRALGTTECLTTTLVAPLVVMPNAGLSPDGAWAAYWVRHSGHHQLYLHDRAAGTRTSVATSLNPSSAGFEMPQFSGDGRYLAFPRTTSWNPKQPIGGPREVYVYDRVTTTTRLVTSVGAGAPSGGQTWGVAISHDGRWVAFGSDASGFVPGIGGTMLTYVRDLETNAVALASHTPAGQAPDSSATPLAISDGGLRVMFLSSATNLVPGVSGLRPYVWDRLADTVGVGNLGTDGVVQTVPSYQGTLSTDGSLYVFENHYDWNLASLHIHDRTRSVAFPFCPGESGCPCGNAGTAGAGCENSFGTGGARIAADGNANPGDDELTLVATGLPPTSTPVLFFQGSTAAAGGAGTPFGDGLLCMQGSITRIGQRIASGGASSYGAVHGDVPVSVRGMVPPGARRLYQATYRNLTPAFCTPAGFNQSNAVEIHWGW